MTSWYPYQTKNKSKRDLSKLPRFKLVLLGDASVGKTTISKRFNNKPIVDNGSTIGCAFLTHIYTDDSTSPPTEFRLDMWDTAGQERYFSLVDIYFKDCDVALLVYDIKRPDTLQNIFDRWLPQYLKSRYHNHINWETSTEERQKIIYLIGNKADNDGDDTILSLLKTNQSLLDRYDIHHVQLSALTGRHFQDFLDNLYQELTTKFLPEYPKRIQKINQAKTTGVVSPHNEEHKHRFNLASCCRIS